MANSRPPSRKGIPNKNKKFLLTRLQDMYGEDFHPIMQMADSASKMNKLTSEIEEKYKDDPDGHIDKLFIAYRAELEAWSKIAEYTEPKLKAVEVKHTNLPKVKLVDLTGRPRLDDNIIDVEDEPRTANDTD